MFVVCLELLTLRFVLGAGGGGNPAISSERIFSSHLVHEEKLKTRREAAWWIKAEPPGDVIGQHHVVLWRCCSLTP